MVNLNGSLSAGRGRRRLGRNRMPHPMQRRQRGPAALRSKVLIAAVVKKRIQVLLPRGLAPLATRVHFGRMERTLPTLKMRTHLGRVFGRWGRSGTAPMHASSATGPHKRPSSLPPLRTVDCHAGNDLFHRPHPISDPAALTQAVLPARWHSANDEGSLEVAFVEIGSNTVCVYVR